MTKYDIGFHNPVRFSVFGNGYSKEYLYPLSDGMLKDFAKKFKNWEKEGHAIWAFFNNDIHGFAIEDARRLTKLVEKKKQRG